MELGKRDRHERTPMKLSVTSERINGDLRNERGMGVNLRSGSLNPHPTFA